MQDTVQEAPKTLVVPMDYQAGASRGSYPKGGRVAETNTVSNDFFDPAIMDLCAKIARMEKRQFQREEVFHSVKRLLFGEW